MLLGEDFGRGEQCGLKFVGDGGEHGVERDDGLAAADIALEQAVHGVGGLEVLQDLPDGVLLGVGEGEPEAFADTLVEKFVSAEDGGGEPAIAEALADAEAKLHEHQLVVDDPAAGLLGFVLVRRQMDGTVGLAAWNQLVLVEQ